MSKINDTYFVPEVTIDQLPYTITGDNKPGDFWILRVTNNSEFVINDFSIKVILPHEKEKGERSVATYKMNQFVSPGKSTSIKLENYDNNSIIDKIEYTLVLHDKNIIVQYDTSEGVYSKLNDEIKLSNKTKRKKYFKRSVIILLVILLFMPLYPMIDREFRRFRSAPLGVYNEDSNNAKIIDNGYIGQPKVRIEDLEIRNGKEQNKTLFNNSDYEIVYCIVGYKYNDEKGCSSTHKPTKPKHYSKFGYGTIHWGKDAEILFIRYVYSDNEGNDIKVHYDVEKNQYEIISVRESGSYDIGQAIDNQENYYREIAEKNKLKETFSDDGTTESTESDYDGRMPYVTVDQIPLSSISIVKKSPFYKAIATFKNNSKFTITDYAYTVIYSDGKKASFVIFSSVQSGDRSEEMEIMPDNSMIPDEVVYSYIDSSLNKITVIYNFDTQTYVVNDSSSSQLKVYRNGKRILND